MRRTVWLLILVVLLPLTAAAQETRGNISGTVRDAQGVIPFAMVRITNIDTKVTQNLVTNESGYFEAPLNDLKRFFPYRQTTPQQSRVPILSARNEA